MTLIYKQLFLVIAIIIDISSADRWWPEQCNTADTVINGPDTIITKYKCKENGTKEILRKKNGKYNGLYTAWSQNGNKIEELTYFEDKFNGEIRNWDTTGFLKIHRFFAMGKPIGFHQDFYSKGKPKSFIHYNDSGKKHGLEESWRLDGTRKDSTVWENGIIIELRTYYYDGKVRHWIQKVDESKSRIENALYYDPKGTICGQIKKGNGTYVIWSEDTKDRWLKSYKDGEEISSRELTDGENPSLK